MKRVLSALCLTACLLLSACAPATEPTMPAPATAEAPTEEYRPKGAGAESAVMTPTAQTLGITYEDYPRIDGSTSTLGLVRAVWRAMVDDSSAAFGAGYPEEAGKTVPSYHKLLDGEADMIFVPYASEDVLQAADDAGVELEFHKVAAEALIFITPKDNSADNITREQVRSIYLHNAIDNWKKLGGPRRKLVPICRNADSGSQSQLDNLVLDNEPMHPAIEKNHVELTMEGMLDQVAYYHSGGFDGKPTRSYALGYTLYSYLINMTEMTGVGDNLKILDYEGITPERENIADGSYPLADGYYAVIRSDLPEDHSARAIISWLQSEDGVAAIERIGLIPCA